MRRNFVRIHRWLGLFMAAFLIVAGLTGALIAWEHELDAALNPELYHARSAGTQGAAGLSALDLADRVEAADPEALVTYLPLSAEAGHTLSVYVSGRPDASGVPHELDYSQVAFDPVTGEVQAQRKWGAARLDALHLMPFIYKLHYSLHLPLAGTTDTGMLLMGLVAVAWTLDCFVALWIAFPNRKAWRKSLAFRVRQGGAKLNFDLHRSGGVWAWGILLAFAITAVSLNLGHEVVRPAVNLLSPLAPDPFHDPPVREESWQARSRLSRAQVLALASEAAHAEGITSPPGGLFLSSVAEVYAVGFFEAGQDHADGRLGNPWFYFDARSGKPVGQSLPGEGSAGDVFMQAQFPLHSGRLFGVPGRVVVSLLGLFVAMLSVTGVVIWARRRRARARAQAEAPAGSEVDAAAHA